MPLIMDDGQPFVSALGKSGEYWIHIDTGTRNVRMLPSGEKELQARSHLVFPTLSGDAAGMKRWSWTAWRVRELDMGGAKFQDFDTHIVDCGHMFAGSNVPVRIIAGTSLFRDCLLTIDLPGRRLVIAHGDLPPENGRDILPCRRGKGGSPEIPVEIGGKKLWAGLDTGAYNAVNLGADVAAGMAFDGAPATRSFMSHFSPNATCTVATLSGDVVFGQYRVHKPMIDICGRDESAWICLEILKDYRITLDQKNRRVRLERGAIVGKP